MRLRIPSVIRTLYWMRRQKGLDVRDWSELADVPELDGASIAIVGNAGYLKDARFGRLIDAHDLVLRMNNFHLDGFEAAIGSRTDIFITNFSAHTVKLDRPELRAARFILSSRPNSFQKYRRLGIRDVFGRNITSGMFKIGRHDVFSPPLNRFVEWTRQLGAYPTTGAMAILLVSDVLLNYCGHVYITGFSFFEGLKHYFNPTIVREPIRHNLPDEKNLLRERLAGLVATGRVELDPIMSDHLWGPSFGLRRAA